MINKFCTHLHEDHTSQTVEHRAFSASFQDQTAGLAGQLSEKQTEKLDTPSADHTNSFTKCGNQDCRTECLCGKIHCFADCLYLVELKRGHNWIADEEISHTICEKIFIFFLFFLFYSYSDLAGEPCRTSRYILFFPENLGRNKN